MTEQEMQELKEILSKGTPTHWELFNKVLEMQQENERLQKQVEFNRKYGIHSNAMQEIERLRKALEDILKKFNELSDYPQIKYSGLDEIARKALEGGVE